MKSRSGAPGSGLYLIVLLSIFLTRSVAMATSLPDEVRLLTAHLVPYSMQGQAQQGFMIELVEEIERRLGSSREINFLPWSRSLRLAKLTPNHIIFPVTRTPEREHDYQWLIKVAPIELVFVTLAGEPLSLVEARALETISVQQDTPFEQFLHSMGFDNLVSMPNAAAYHLRMLQLKRIQAWFTARDLAFYSWNEQQTKVPLVMSDSVYRSDVYIATSKQFPPQLASLYQQTFVEMREDGTLGRIMQRYRPLND